MMMRQKRGLSGMRYLYPLGNVYFLSSALHYFFTFKLQWNWYTFLTTVIFWTSRNYEQNYKPSIWVSLDQPCDFRLLRCQTVIIASCSYRCPVLWFFIIVIDGLLSDQEGTKRPLPEAEVCWHHLSVSWLLSAFSVSVASRRECN